MKKIFLSYALCFLAFTSFSQIISLESVIIDSGTLNPIADALVTIDGTSLAEFTSEKGEFIIWDIPQGRQIVTITKKGYVPKIFILTVEKEVPFTIEKIALEVSKKEKNRRKKIKREEEKKIKALLARKERAIKARNEKINEIRKQNNNSVVIDYRSDIKYNPTDTVSVENEVTGFSAIQEKYAKILDVEPSEIDNIELYNLIENWYPTTYLLGGSTDDGIDCSSFTQLIFSEVYKKYIERTADKQYESKFSDRFKNKSELKEGDLLFFDKGNGEDLTITHVGLYLKNDMFVHSTSRKSKEKGANGVQISNLSELFWKKRLVCGAKRLDE
ncbi:MAG: NlpC/P60 family protein [Flavobacteriaceae bacterium]|nr:NlpC/P60 family protein [Flavobacteriaceae bacterium]